MEIPANATADVYKNEFTYRNKITGKTQQFNDTNYPWKDSINWQYVNMKSKLVKSGYHPPIHDFSIVNNNGEDVTDLYLNELKNTFILVAYNLELSSVKSQDKINELARQSIGKGWNFICLTASSAYEINNFTRKYKPPYEFFTCDQIALKTMIRSNPGLILLRNGTIINNWHWRDIPSINEVK